MKSTDLDIYFDKARTPTLKTIHMIVALREMFDDLPEDVRIHVANKISMEAKDMRVHARAMHSECEGWAYTEEDFYRLVHKDEPKW